MEQKYKCHNCGLFDKPAFDDKCSSCGTALFRSDDMRDDMHNPQCSECGSKIEESSIFCTECGAKLNESDNVELSSKVDDSQSDHCKFCGLDFSIEEMKSDSSCPRCFSLIAERDDSDDKEDDDSNKDNDSDDSEDDSDDESDSKSKKKQLLDKRKDESSVWRSAKQITAQDEARIALEFATELDENQIKELAAHLVWPNLSEDLTDYMLLSEKPPVWVPDAYKETWQHTVNTGRPKTMMSAVNVFKNVVAGGIHA